MQGLVVVGLGGGVVAELQAVQGDAEGAGREESRAWEKFCRVAMTWREDLADDVYLW